MEEKAERAMLTGASAAKRLADACEPPAEGAPSLRLDTVRGLALDLGRHLAGLAAEDPNPSLLAEAAQKCADLATLAACNADEIDYSDAAEAIRLAAEATESLRRAVETRVPSDEEAKDGRSDLVRRDARSASWKASLAARQMGVS
ncbi:MAG: hypothetical protein H0U65_09135 [Rubrobacter sp.]|nr:hypothetical protein [Rubrobacter sp.]